MNRRHFLKALGGVAVAPLAAKAAAALPVLDTLRIGRIEGFDFYEPVAIEAASPVVMSVPFDIYFDPEADCIQSAAAIWSRQLVQRIDSELLAAIAGGS